MKTPTRTRRPSSAGCTPRGAPQPLEEITPQLRARAHAEIRAGHFEAVRDLLAQHRGTGPEIDMLLGMALAGLGDPDDAATLICPYALENPTLQHPAMELIEIFISLERRAELEPILRACLELTPQDARLFDALGAVLTQTGQLDEAIATLRHSLALRPANPQTQNALANTLNEAGAIAEAEEIFRGILRLDPDHFGTLSNLACLLSNDGRIEESLHLYRQSIRNRPADPRVRLNHSIALLKAGCFAQGWTEHEWRLQLPGHSTLPSATLLPNVTAGLDLAGKTILITQEEGLGDTLMYLRYLPSLARRGALVHAWVPSELASLTRRVEGVAEVQVGGETPDFDWHCPFISLPRAFSATSDALGHAVPYLRGDPKKIAAWKKKLPEHGNLRVGIVWGGAPRPKHSNSYMLDRRRSIPLHMLEPLAGIEGVDLINLQFGPAAEQLDSLQAKMNIFDPMGDVRDMDDTAAIVSNLDVVVSVDTSIVHLAGGLGCKVILMDRFDNCWRWMSNREDSIWYPSLSIVRQTSPQDWGDVPLRVAAQLRAMVKARQKNVASGTPRKSRAR